MPVYEFRCEACGERTDRILSVDDKDRPGPCPACSGELSRRFSRVAVRYEGWGFNATDRLVGERPGGRNDFKTVRERAEQLSDTGEL